MSLLRDSLGKAARTWTHVARRSYATEPISKKEKSEALKEQFRKGYFYGLKDVLQKSQKKSEAKEELSRPEVSLRLSSIPVTTLLGKQADFAEETNGKISLLLIGFSEHTRPMTDSFAKPFLASYGQEKDIQCLEVTIANPWLSLLKPFIISGIKKTHPPERHGHVGLFTKESVFLEKHLNIPTKFLGYSFLVDRQAKIRWSAHEVATPNEIQAMLKLTKVLQQE